MRRKASLAMLSLALPGWLPAAAPLSVVHPGPRSAADTRSQYYIELLDLALRQSGAPFTRRAHTLPMVGARIVHDMKAGLGINVTWLPTNAELERELIPVKVPLDRGILGWRVFLVRKEDRRRFAAVQTLAQLQRLAAGQQRDWGDVAILRANGLPVVTSTTYEGIFQMLAAGRFDYCPRGVGEIWAEAALYKEMGLVVEETLALHYAFPSYFFVSPLVPELAAALEQGLAALQRDGSLDKLFEHYHGDSIRRARLSGRRVFELQLPG